MQLKVRPVLPTSAHAQKIAAAGRVMRAVAVVALGAVLLWQVITHTLAAYLASVAPEAALWLRPTHPAALLSLAEHRLAGEVGSAGIERVRDLAERALHSDPLNAGALRLLGQMADARGDPEQAAKLMEAAARLSIHEGFAVARVMERRLSEGDFRSGLRLADGLLRTRPDLIPAAARIIAAAARDDAARPHLERLLAANPPWRNKVLAAVPGTAADADGLLDLVLGLKTSPSPPTAVEVRPYLEHLVRNGRYEAAYYAWLQLLPDERLERVGLLYNGSFSHDPDGAPFDWEIAAGRGALIDLAAQPDRQGQRILRLVLGPGRVELGKVRQMTVLPGGNYRLLGSRKAELSGPRGLKWRVTCAATMTVIGEEDMILNTGPSWQQFQVSFKVPDRDCRAQFVELVLDARSPSEQLVYGTASYADVRIERQP